MICAVTSKTGVGQTARCGLPHRKDSPIGTPYALFLALTKASQQGPCTHAQIPPGEHTMKNCQTQRRQFLKLGGTALAMIPVMVTLGRAEAAKNASTRTALKYQGKPEGDKSCAKCMQFVPGPSAKALGSCKVIPGDTEISPNGYCTAWAKKA